ncbi:MACPF domain-containing protein CAD1 [Acorus calamus]|uniref:MACPF domain-containing protein CAD1 n=1 Tax=Acorus calamus TaxID=4465 RepID=A0AAV9F2N8_ACOCL|nr:MACPF domain-containing protein CAD1 [Acorus calamus]
MADSSSGGLAATLNNSIEALGRGFDVASDIRLLYCKGAPGSRLVRLDEENVRDLRIDEASLVINRVSMDIGLSKENIGRETTPVWTFHETSRQ